MIRELRLPCADYACSVMGTRLNTGHDFYVGSSGGARVVDCILFLDSRGISRSYETSLVRLLLDALQARNMSYLCVVRPVELTVFATLLSFLRLSRVRGRVLVTNLGFVDLTPKKKTAMLDIVAQYQWAIPETRTLTRDVGDWQLSDGSVQQLASIVLDDRHAERIAHAMSEVAERSVVLGTPSVSRSMRLERERPPAFYAALGDTQAFLRLLSKYGVRVLQPCEFDDALTYDAVHYTAAGNQLMFDLLRDNL